MTHVCQELRFSFICRFCSFFGFFEFILRLAPRDSTANGCRCSLKDSYIGASPYALGVAIVKPDESPEFSFYIIMGMAKIDLTF